jgi:hypothetical protein
VEGAWCVRLGGGSVLAVGTGRPPLATHPLVGDFMFPVSSQSGLLDWAGDRLRESGRRVF